MLKISKPGDSCHFNFILISEIQCHVHTICFCFSSSPGSAPVMSFISYLIVFNCSVSFLNVQVQALFPHAVPCFLVLTFACFPEIIRVFCTNDLDNNSRICCNKEIIEFLHSRPAIFHQTLLSYTVKSS